MANDIHQIYKYLLKLYGNQGWWPIINGSTLLCEYHTNAPRTAAEQFEICIGAILTQNTSWLQAEKALQNLKKAEVLDSKAINIASPKKIKQLIRPAGYFNEKAKKLRAFADFYMALRGKNPSRRQLLSVWGIGNETADSMLLYAYKQLSFVVDAYTRRILLNLKLIRENSTYQEIKDLFEDNLPRSTALYQEYHALIVKHAKRFYGQKLDFNKDPLILFLGKKK